MHTKVEEYARQLLKDTIKDLPQANKEIFNLMYGRKCNARGLPTNTPEEAKARDVNEVIDEMSIDKLNWAQQQIENTIAKNARAQGAG